MTAQTVPSAETVTVQVTGPLVHQCPFEDEQDNGAVTITWTTNGKTIELHSLARWLREFADQQVSHEYLTDHLARTLRQLPGIIGVVVTTTWETAGMAVTCSTDAVLRQPRRV